MRGFLLGLVLTASLAHASPLTDLYKHMLQHAEEHGVV